MDTPLSLAMRIWQLVSRVHQRAILRAVHQTVEPTAGSEGQHEASITRFGRSRLIAGGGQ